MAASQHASTRSQQDMAKAVTRSGAVANAAELEPMSATAVRMYFFIIITPLM